MISATGTRKDKIGSLSLVFQADIQRYMASIDMQ
jgi:hypothetical protein